jgi:hypothetical protein
VLISLVKMMLDRTSANSHERVVGGQGGIRTHDTLAGMPHFECGAIDHSTTCPPAVIKKARRQGKVFSCP